MTLRNRLLWASGLLIVVLIVTSFAVVRLATAHLVGRVDDQLERFAPPPLRSVPGPPMFDPAAPAPRDDSPFSSLFFGAFDGDQLETVVAPSLGSSSSAVPVITRVEAERLAASGQHASVDSSPSGTEYRVAVRKQVSPDGDLVVVGIPLTDVNSAISRLVTLQLVASGVVIALLVLVIWSVLRLSVRPLRQMSTAASQVAAGGLSLELPDAPAGTEAAELGEALSTMLKRIEVALEQSRRSEERMRQFLADASHELRTPVTTIRGYAELYRLGGLDDRAERDAAMGRVEGEAVRMASMVASLLTLARLDRETDHEWDRVDLAEVVRDAVADLAVAHPARDVTTDVRSAFVNGIRDHLYQVVTNLISNAINHTQAPASISVQVRTDSDAVTLRVIDRGPGMSHAERERAFDRFYRVDQSRSRTSGGTGLGLSIVDGIVNEHGGTLSLHDTDPTDADLPGITAVVRLPAAGRGETDTDRSV